MTNKKSVIRPDTVPRLLGDWSPSDHETLKSWLAGLVNEAEKKKAPFHPVIGKFKALIENDPEVYMYFTQMFSQIPHKQKFRKDSMGDPQIKNYHQMLRAINHILTTAPNFNMTGMAGLPILAILDWPMGTPAGTAAFLNHKVNAIFKEILVEWCKFLDGKKSLYVLNKTGKGWFSREALKKIGGIKQYKHDPNKPHWGFKSWNDFFTREFKNGERPVTEPDDDTVIVSACESVPFCISSNVRKHSKFWIKSQPYSLEFMLSGGDYARQPKEYKKYVGQFIGGTVYQAFLSAFNYHRWHSPVSGIIKKAFVKEGSYYAEALSEGFDPFGPTNSQGFITHVATRALIYIECDNPVIGLMCVMPVGMAEVSSCQITVKEGDRVKKGDEIGYFQFGGSTHCLLFRPGSISGFALDAIPQPEYKGVVKVNSKIADSN